MTGSGSLGVVHDDLEAGSAAAAAVASGEKKEVALLPAMKEELSSRKAEVDYGMQDVIFTLARPCFSRHWRFSRLASCLCS